MCSYKLMDRIYYVVVTVLLFCPASLVAQPDFPMGENNPNRREQMQRQRQHGMASMLKELGLSKEQRTKLKALRDSMRSGENNPRHAIKKAMHNLSSAVRDGADDSEIDILVSKLGDQFKAMAVKARKFNSILTEEQRAKMRQMQQQGQRHRQQRMRDMMERGARGGY